MISLAFALAMAAPPELSDETAIAEEPAYEADTHAVIEEPQPRIQGGLTPEQLVLLKRAIAKAEAERIADNAAREAAARARWPLGDAYQPPVPAPSQLREPLPNLDCSGPLCVAQRREDTGARRADAPAADTRITAEQRLAQLLPIAWVVAGAALAFALWRFLRPRWRSYVPIGRRIIAGYWREIGLFTMLGAIFLKLW